jgi:ketosteroid isomerase-like protein
LSACLVLNACLALSACATGTTPVSRPVADTPALVAQVMATERAFARSMAERNFAAFTEHLSADAVFFSGPQVLRGKAAVAEGWKKFFSGQRPPFSWEPDHVEVLASGDLALSTGPVHAPDGTLVGRFNSVWRREGAGLWRIVLDKGEDVCRASTTP